MLQIENHEHSCYPFHTDVTDPAFGGSMSQFGFWNQVSAALTTDSSTSRHGHRTRGTRLEAKPPNIEAAGQGLILRDAPFYNVSYQMPSL